MILGHVVPTRGGFLVMIPNDPDAKQELAILSFAIRLILAELDHRLLIERGLESLADFGHCDNVAIF